MSMPRGKSSLRWYWFLEFESVMAVALLAQVLCAELLEARDVRNRMTTYIWIAAVFLITVGVVWRLVGSDKPDTPFYFRLFWWIVLAAEMLVVYVLVHR